MFWFVIILFAYVHAPTSEFLILKNLRCSCGEDSRKSILGIISHGCLLPIEAVSEMDTFSSYHVTK